MKSPVIIVLAFLCSQPAFANEQEIEQLHRLRSELTLVVHLVDQSTAKFRYDPHKTANFRYDELKRRLVSLQEHIDQHIRFVNKNPKLKRFEIQ